MPYTGLHGRRRHDGAGATTSSRSPSTSAPATRSGGRSPPRTAPRPRCSSCSDRAGQHHRRPPAGRRRVRRPMTGVERRPVARPRADPRALRPPQRASTSFTGGDFTDDPYPGVARAARDRARPRRAPCTSSPGIEGDAVLARPARARTGRTSRRSATRRATHAYRNPEVFASSPGAVDAEPATSAVESSMLVDGRRRSTAATARSCSRRSCRPRRSGGSRKWIERDGARADRRVRRRGPGRAQRRLLRRHPGAHDHRQLRHRRRPGARRPRARSATRPRSPRSSSPIVAARRDAPAGRPHQRAGRRPRSPTRTATHRLSRRRDLLVRLPAARRRVGHDLEADGHHPRRAAAAARACSTRSATTARCCKPAIEESLRWEPTDPMFSRWVTEDTELLRHRAPEGLGRCTSASARPTATPSAGSGPTSTTSTGRSKPVVRLRRRSAHLPRHARRPGRDDRRHRRPARPAARTCGSTPTPSRRRLIGFYERGVTGDPGGVRMTGDDRDDTTPTTRCSATSTSAATARPTARSATSGTARRRCCSRRPAARSGEPRTSPLIFGRDGDDYLVVASVGGTPKHPAWYLNLAGRPAAPRSRCGPTTSTSTARTASPDEKPRLWQIVNEVWPNYDVYQSRTDRVIPVVVLTPAELIGRFAACPPPRRKTEAAARRRNGTRGPANTEALLAAAHRLVARAGRELHDAGPHQGGRRRAADLLPPLRRQGPDPPRRRRRPDRRALRVAGDEGGASSTTRSSASTSTSPRRCRLLGADPGAAAPGS